MPARRPTAEQVFAALTRFADRMVDPVADEVMAAFRVTRRSVDLDELERVLLAIYERAPFARAAQAPILDAAARAALVRAMRIDDVFAPQLERRLASVLSKLSTGGALVTIQGMPDRIQPSFNVVNPRAVAYSSKHAGRLVREMVDEQRQQVARVVSRGIRDGIEPRKTARTLREFIGLTRYQEGLVSRFRDVHADDMRARAVAGETLTAEQRKRLRQLQSAAPRTAADVESLTARYRERKLRERSMAIARTETIRASAGGQMTAWDEAGREGLIVREETRRFWMYTKDSRTECSCKSIPVLNPDGVPLDKPFLMQDCHGGGGIRKVNLPGDSHPLCRCVLYVRFVEARLPVAA